MSFRPGKLLLVVLVPVLAYGALKGVMYYNAKSAVDEVVASTAHMVDIRYSDISTDLRGAVTVSGISVQPMGFSDTLGIDSVRIASDDRMFFIRGGQWEPGSQEPPPSSLSFHISGVHLPLSSDIIQAGALKDQGSSDSCEQGLQIEPGFLTRMGFSELNLDMDGYYRLDEISHSLDIGINMDLHDIESMEFAATMNDVDVETLAGGAAPQFSLGRMSLRMRVPPQFGRQVLKTCAVGTEQTVEQWSRILADNALAQMRQEGLSLGYGLSNAVHTFYRDWGDFEVVAAPSEPVGLLSLMFLPPDQLADTLALHMRLNGETITDTRFTLESPQGAGLSGLFGGQQSGGGTQAGKKQQRVQFRHSYEGVPVKQIADYVGHKVQLKPQGQPMREGLLRAVGNGEVEVQQALHGGKYSVHVPLSQIESVKVLVREEIRPKG